MDDLTSKLESVIGRAWSRYLEDRGLVNMGDFTRLILGIVETEGWERWLGERGIEVRRCVRSGFSSNEARCSDPSRTRGSDMRLVMSRELAMKILTLGELP